MGCVAGTIGKGYRRNGRGPSRARSLSLRACAGQGHQCVVARPSCAVRVDKTLPCLYGNVSFREREEQRGCWFFFFFFTFATDERADFGPASGLRRLFDPLEGYAVPFWLLDTDIAVGLYVQRVERAHLDVLVLFH